MIRLRDLRLQHGISAAKLAKFVGVSRQTVHTWEAGHFPKNEHLEKAAEFFRKRGLIGKEVPSQTLLEVVPADLRIEVHSDLIDKRSPQARATKTRKS